MNPNAFLDAISQQVGNTPTGMAGAGDDMSLMNSIQQYYTMLDQLRQRDLALGNNRALQDATNNANLSTANVAQGLAGAVPPELSQWVQDPNSLYAQKAQALIGMGPTAFAPQGVGSFMPQGSPGSMQAGIRDWQRAVDNAIFDARSSISDRVRSPEEMQQAQIASQIAGPTAAKGLLAGLAPEAGVDRDQLGLMAGLAQKDIASRNAMLGEKYKTDAALISDAAKNKTAIDVASIDAAAKSAMLKAENQKLDVKDVTDKQDKADDSANKLAKIQNLAKGWKPEFYTARKQAIDRLGDKFDKLGLPNDLQVPGYDEYFAQVDDVLKQDIKELAGARGLSNESARKYILHNMFDEAKDPTTAQLNLTNYMTNAYVNDAVAKANLQFAKNNGVKLDENSDLFKQLHKQKMDALSPEMYETARQSIYDAHPNLYPSMSAGKLGQTNDLTVLQRELKFQRDPELKLFIQAKIKKLQAAGAK